jgi:thiosulfate dehydrogenase [quinone] large subunit
VEKEDAVNARRIVYVVLAIAGSIILTQGPNWVDPKGPLSALGSSGTVLTNVVGLVLVLLSLYLASQDKSIPSMIVPDPPAARFFFNDLRSAPFWLPFRIFVGWSYLSSGFGKITNPAWFDTGEALVKAWTNATTPNAAGVTPAPYPWFVSFLKFMIDTNAASWFKYVIMFGELAVGLGLVLGFLTGIAAFSGSIMNLMFMFMGSVSSNPLFFAIEAALVLAWKVCGYIGFDRWLLPKLGTPWGHVEVDETRPAATPAAAPTPQT